MRKIPFLRTPRINRACFLTVFFLFSFLSPVLFGSDLDRAADLEASGDLESAADLYESWLNRRANRTDPDYGRTLLHLLRSGGSPGGQLALLEKYLPYVNNAYDREEVLKFGAYLAELSGNLELAEKYFILLQEKDPRYDWIPSYLNLQEDKIRSVDDPLMSSLLLDDEDHIASRLILYLLTLSLKPETGREAENWIRLAEQTYPFLVEHPSWLYQVWSVSGIFELDELTDKYRERLIRNFGESPESGIVEFRISPYGNPLLLSAYSSIGESPGEETPAAAATGEFLQLGSFSDLGNAESLKENVEGNTSFSLRIVFQDGLYKVLLPTASAESDRQNLKQRGFDSFRVNLP